MLCMLHFGNVGGRPDSGPCNAQEPVRSLHEAWDCLLERSCKQERARGHRAKTGLRLSSRSHSVVTVAVYKPLLDIVPGGSAASLGAPPPALIAQQRGAQQNHVSAQLFGHGIG